MAEHTIFMYSAIIAVLILLDSLTDQISHLSGSNLLFALVHDINGAVSLCENLSDRILVMYEGEIVGEFDPKTTTVQELGLYMAGARKQGKEEQ